MSNWTPLLSGVVGSTAYGLAHAGSDVDRLAVAAAPTVDFHGLNPPRDKSATRVRHDPDSVTHEAAKYIGLVLKANPTVTELLWLDSYEVRTELGDDLIRLRYSLLSAHAVKAAYLGYATAQFQRLIGKGRFPNVPRERIAKHGRHLCRLLEQGTSLWRMGTLSVRLENPESVRLFGQRVAHNGNEARPVMEWAEKVFTEEPPALLAEPDVKAAEAWLRRVRAEHYRLEAA